MQKLQHVLGNGGYFKIATPTRGMPHHGGISPIFLNFPDLAPGIQVTWKCGVHARAWQRDACGACLEFPEFYLIPLGTYVCAVLWSKVPILPFHTTHSMPDLGGACLRLKGREKSGFGGCLTLGGLVAVWLWGVPDLGGLGTV